MFNDYLRSRLVGRERMVGTVVWLRDAALKENLSELYSTYESFKCIGVASSASTIIAGDHNINPATRKLRAYSLSERTPCVPT